MPREALGYCELQSCSSSVHILAAPEVSAGATPIRWTPDGRGVAYVNAAGGENIWIQPRNGEATPLTRFTDGKTIKGFAWSPESGRLAILRETTRSNVVLYRGLTSTVGRN